MEFPSFPTDKAVESNRGAPRKISVEVFMATPSYAIIISGGPMGNFIGLYASPWSVVGIHGPVPWNTTGCREVSWYSQEYSMEVCEVP